MAILVTNIKLGLEQSEEAALEQAIRRIGVSKHHIQDIHLYKKIHWTRANKTNCNL